jgi:hypothetical protein
MHTVTFIQLSSGVKHMNKNVGGIDRTVRVVVGVALVALAATETLGAWAYVGIVPILTGAIGWCPAYLPFGLSTCKTRSQ